MIEIGEYTLEPDTGANGWMLSRYTTVGSDGRRRYNHRSYHGTIPAALNALLNERLRDVDPDTLAEVRDEIRQFRADLSELFTLKVEA